MHRRMMFLPVWLAVALFTSLSAPRLQAQTGTVRCESRGSDREQCPIEAGATVELARHLSATPCRQNANWGVGQGFVWVSGGCRAEFAVTAGAFPPSPGNAGATQVQLRACRTEADRRLPGYSYAQIQVEPQTSQGSTAWIRWRAENTGGMCAVTTSGRIVQFTTGSNGGGGGPGIPATTRLTCESRSTERQECRIPAGAEVRLVRQVSQNSCRLNDTYGKGAGYVWVAKGCRGEFEISQASVSPVPVPGGGAGGVTRLVCQSSLTSPRQCPIPSGATASLARQISDRPCRLGQTYGTSTNYVWVSQGCVGEFSVSRAGAPGGNPGTGLSENVTCESKGGERTECRIRSGGRVRLVRQLSTTPCTKNSTWGSGFAAVWVTKGCRAEFEVR